MKDLWQLHLKKYFAFPLKIINISVGVQVGEINFLRFHDGEELIYFYLSHCFLLIEKHGRFLFRIQLFSKRCYLIFTQSDNFAIKYGLMEQKQIQHNT